MAKMFWGLSALGLTIIWVKRIFSITWQPAFAQVHLQFQQQLTWRRHQSMWLQLSFRLEWSRAPTSTTDVCLGERIDSSSKGMETISGSKFRSIKVVMKSTHNKILSAWFFFLMDHFQNLRDTLPSLALESLLLQFPWNCAEMIDEGEASRRRRLATNRLSDPSDMTLMLYSPSLNFSRRTLIHCSYCLWICPFFPKPLVQSRFLLGRAFS